MRGGWHAHCKIVACCTKQGSMQGHLVVAHLVLVIGLEDVHVAHMLYMTDDRSGPTWICYLIYQVPCESCLTGLLSTHAPNISSWTLQSQKLSTSTQSVVLRCPFLNEAGDAFKCSGLLRYLGMTFHQSLNVTALS